jgi:hypothetical protein
LGAQFGQHLIETEFAVMPDAFAGKINHFTFIADSLVHLSRQFEFLLTKS